MTDPNPNPTIRYLLSDEALMDELERTGAAPAQAFDLVDSMDSQLRETVLSIIEKVRELDQAELIHGFVAAHTNYPRILSALASSPDAEVRTGVAKIELTQPAFLRRLALDPVVAVRQAVAENPGTPIDALTALASDLELSVRAGVAGNPGTPAEMLGVLNQSGKFARELAGNPSTPDSVLAGIHTIVANEPYSPSDDDSRPTVAVILAGNPSNTADTLRVLAAHPDPDVRLAVATNESAPLSVIRVLEKDRSPEVAATARQVLES